jgi:hypothetical protein
MLLLVKETDNRTKSEEFTNDTKEIIHQSTANLVALKAQHCVTGTCKE